MVFPPVLTYVGGLGEGNRFSGDLPDRSSIYFKIVDWFLIVELWIKEWLGLNNNLKHSATLVHPVLRPAECRQETSQQDPPAPLALTHVCLVAQLPSQLSQIPPLLSRLPAEPSVEMPRLRCLGFFAIFLYGKKPALGTVGILLVRHRRIRVERSSAGRSEQGIDWCL